MNAAIPSDGGDRPLVFVVAGEPSGDQLGARLMAALKRETGGRIRFAGLGGELMADEGLVSLFPISELAIMGIIEVVPRVLHVYRRVRETVAAAAAESPAVLVTIDSPSFTLEVSKRLRQQRFPRVHYVAPTVWAWKPWRARRMARYLDRLLVLLPFEPPYFERYGLPTTFVGHPAVEARLEPTDTGAFRARHAIPCDAPLLCLLPGSRRSEVSQLLPIFGETLAILKGRFPDLCAVVPTLATVSQAVGTAARAWPIPAVVLEDPREKFKAFAAADAALAASGTVAVELAVAGLPTVITYRISRASAWLLRRVLLNRRLRYVSLINLVAGREVQPELLQERCRPDMLAPAVERLLGDPAARDAQRDACREAVQRLHSDSESPSERAARAVLELIASGEAPRKGTIR